METIVKLVKRSGLKKGLEIKKHLSDYCYFAMVDTKPAMETISVFKGKSLLGSFKIKYGV